MEPVKIVARFADGRIKKGYSKDFSPNRSNFHLMGDRAGGSGEPEEIQVADLKAVFFVHDSAGSPNDAERKTFAEGDSSRGQKVQVAFADGELLSGSVPGYSPKESGFFLFPADPGSKHMRIFVVNASVKEFRYLGAHDAPKPAKSDYQCLFAEPSGNLLMVSGKEKKVLKLVLSKVLGTDSGREYITGKLGNAYLSIAEELLKEMESD
jgi:Family of unknown function (DUF6982)